MSPDPNAKESSPLKVLGLDLSLLKMKKSFVERREKKQKQNIQTTFLFV